MDQTRRSRAAWRRKISSVWLIGVVAAGCAKKNALDPAAHSSVLRIGVSLGQMASANPASGLRQVAQNQAIESLARIGDDGRPQPLVASSWTLSEDRSALDITLRSGIKFSDGTPVTASTVKQVLDTMLPRAL